MIEFYMRNFLLTLLIIIYSPNEKTNQIKIYDLEEKENLIDIVCAEGVSYNECQGLEKPQIKTEAISYEDIQNYVVRGRYQF